MFKMFSSDSISILNCLYNTSIYSPNDKYGNIFLLRQLLKIKLRCLSLSKNIFLSAVLGHMLSEV